MTKVFKCDILICSLKNPLKRADIGGRESLPFKQSNSDYFHKESFGIEPRIYYFGLIARVFRESRPFTGQHADLLACQAGSPSIICPC